ncbi:hypothetical protein COCVIDRAFT_110942, partial [Bipolaris victoriae FI3]
TARTPRQQRRAHVGTQKSHPLRRQPCRSLPAHVIIRGKRAPCYVPSKSEGLPSSLGRLGPPTNRHARLVTCLAGWPRLCGSTCAWDTYL